MSHSQRTILRAALVALSLLTVSCVDLKPKPAPVVRWISIGETAAQSRIQMPPPTVPGLHLIRTTSAESITDRLIRRLSAFEVTYDDYARWAEPPEQLVQQALEEELFRRRSFVPPRNAPAYRTLSVRLSAFETTPLPRRTALVAIHAKLVDPDGHVLVDRRIEAETPIDGDDPAIAAQGMTASLESVMIELSDLIALK